MVSRRRLLSTVPLVALAGCTSENPGGGDTPTGTPGPAADTTDTLTPTGTGRPTLAPDTVLLTVGDADGEVDLLTVGGVADVGDVGRSRSGAYYVPVELTAAAHDGFADTLGRVGAFENPEAHDIRTYLDGEVVFTATLSPGLADAIQSGEWDGRFRLAVNEESNARRLARHLG